MDDNEGSAKQGLEMLASLPTSTHRLEASTEAETEGPTPRVEDYPSSVGFNEARNQYRLDQKRKRRAQLRAEREKNTREELQKYDTRAVFAKREKQAKDRYGVRTKQRRKSNLHKPKRSGCMVTHENHGFS
uniref:BZIP domain-containing protein n=1 Tax=Peronospora matthiolae TaxID=2874970 RepID=A0AAV1V1H7_9STRA